MPPSYLLSALLDLVRAAAREHSAQALDQRDAPATRSAPPLVDKRALAHPLGASRATVDRLCPQRRIPYVHAGDVRRFDVETVRAALRATGPGPVNAPYADPRADTGPRRSIGPCNAVANASCWLLGSARHKEHAKESARARDGRRSRRGIGTADSSQISTHPNSCEARRSPQPS
jgi:hypothetical protein